MGVYSEYLDNLKGPQEITAERKKQLARIASIRKRPSILTFASDLQKRGPILIDYSDILPIADQIDNLSGDEVDIILETPGGSAEIAEDIMKLLRNRFSKVGVIVPGTAKSAGTIMAMAGDEILMGPTSSLGPIDAQVLHQGKVFSADAFLEGLEKIKREVDETGQLNRAYIPILQGISPGEIQSCENAQKFSSTLVTNWLTNFKFKPWTTHSSSGEPVTDEEKQSRAKEIADHLCDHGYWLTHNRSIKIEDFDQMRLKVVDYGRDPDLFDAIKRYYTLLRMTFDTNIYKLFETPTSQIYRFLSPPAPLPQAKPAGELAMVDFQCPKCQNRSRIQANLSKSQPLQKGAVPFPKDNVFVCPNCGTQSNLVDLRNQIEAQSKKNIV
ncbi:MAG: ATP-dependent Clp protease proteolytic subunit [Dehalococcoidales bacterium]|nr:ATP-dependent Clp protease proteolytic subunit [Dehalococcoidales bacterium]